MNGTRFLMRSSAFALSLLGVIATFAPDHVLEALGAPGSPAPQLMVQVLGATYLGFAALNWMARDNLIGGIYSRPLAIANLTHFLIAGLSTIRLLPDAPAVPMLWPLAIMYSGFAAAFGFVLFRHPVGRQIPEPS